MDEKAIYSLLDSHKQLITLGCEKAILNSAELIRVLVKNAVLEVLSEMGEYKRPKQEEGRRT